MNFTEKVFYNDKPILLTADKEQLVRSVSEVSTFTHFESYSREHLNQAIQLLSDPACPGAVIRDDTPNEAFLQLLSAFKVIPAGGALVSNDHGDILMIYRRGKWDLPKGKQDEGESIEACALREIQEETGLTQLKLGLPICQTYHIYDERGTPCIKHTYWFYMRNTAQEHLVVQTEEDIEQAIWVNKNDLAPFMGNTYRAIKDVLLMAGMTW